MKISQEKFEEHLRDSLKAAATLAPGEVGLVQAPQTGGTRSKYRTGAIAGIGLALSAAAVAVVSSYAGGSGNRVVAGGIAGSQDPAQIVGRWSVSGTGSGGETLALGNGAVLTASCGHMDGSWSASPFGAMLATVGTSVSIGCPTEDPAWMAQTRQYRVESSGDVALLAADGHQTALLSPIARPTPGSSDDVFGSSPAALQALSSFTETLQAQPALPVGVVALSGANLVGTWTSAVNDRAHLTVRGDGAWEASDGCNGTDGLSETDAAGHVLVATMSAETSIGCNGVSIPADWSRTRRVGVDAQERLVLIDATGSILETLNKK